MHFCCNFSILFTVWLLLMNFHVLAIFNIVRKCLVAQRAFANENKAIAATGYDPIQSRSKVSQFKKSIQKK